MNIMEQLKKVLNNSTYERVNTDKVKDSLQKLGVHPSPLFVEFFTNFEGPFWGETLGFELLDLVEEINNIEKSTLICREEFNFASKFLVLTELSANEVIVLNSETDKVYRVDFEGGDEELINGTLQETWAFFGDFLQEFFDINDL